MSTALVGVLEQPTAEFEAVLAGLKHLKVVAAPELEVREVLMVRLTVVGVQ